jgi:glycosyltransferase involved in cell wall biosynthesis
MKAFETTRVSIAMATYNGERYIEAQVRSILKQLGGDDEVVIVDDASTDRTRERIAAFADPRIRLHVNDRNEGVMRSFGRALRMTSGSIIFLADQDDVWLPGKRAALAEALHDAAVAVSDAQVIDGEGAIIAPSFMALRGGFRAGLAATLIRNRYLGCAMAFRRELLEVALPIPAGVPMHDMWLGAVSGLVGRTVYIDRPLMQYRRHEANVSPWRHADPVRMLLWRWQLARNVVARSMAVRCRVGGR